MRLALRDICSASLAKASGRTFSATSRFSLVSRAIDFSHPARAECADDLIRTDFCSGA